MAFMGRLFFRLRLHRLRLPRWVRPRVHYAALGFGLVCVFMLAEADSCDSTRATQQNQQAGQSQLSIYNRNQPVPMYQYSALRSELIAIENQQAKGTLNWAVVYSNDGKPLFTCPIRGFPIPATDQLTNPQQVDYSSSSSGGNVAIAQMEQTGVYTGQTMGTYLPCVEADGSTHIVYAEPLVSTFPYPIEIHGGEVVRAGAPGAGTEVQVR